MKGLLTGIGIGLAIVAMALLGGYVWLDHRVSTVLAQRFDVPLVDIAVPADSASIAEGERVAWLHGCHGCHDAQLQGKVFLDEPRVARLVAPNVTQIVPNYSDAELARLIRHGVRRDSTGVLVMPVATFYDMSDTDVGRLIAHLRATPRVEHELPPNEVRIMGKLGVLEGEFLPEAATMDHHAPRRYAEHDTSQAAHGEYLAYTICAECHGEGLAGDATTPPLFHAMGYTSSQFVSLMLDGRSRDGRDLKLMGRTARSRFVHFTRDEIDALYAYLQALPARAPASASDGSTR